MKHLSSVIVVLLFLAAIFSCEHSYKSACRVMVSDLDQALTTTLEETENEAITPEVIGLFRSKLTLPELKDTSHIVYCFPGDKPSGIYSKEMPMNGSTVRGYADVSFASVFGFADKSIPAAFSLTAVFWMLGSMALTRRNRQTVPRLTPMQKQLFDMFNAAPGRELSREQIRSTLWPGKPMTEDAAYSLIRHLKTSLEGSGYEIETRRGFGYRLKKH